MNSKLFLIYQLSLKELKVKYKNAFLGFSWTIIVPFVMMMIFMVVFNTILKMNISPLFLLVGLFPWTFTTTCINSSTTIFVDNMPLLKKVYFKRYFLVISVISANMISFIISLILLSFFGIKFSHNLIFLIIPIFYQIIFTFGICLFFSSLFVYFRDIKYLVEILLLVWFYLTPIFYSQTMLLNISKKALYIYLVNPMSGIIVLYRDILINGILSNTNLMLLTGFECFITFIAGILVYKKLNGKFIDYA